MTGELTGKQTGNKKSPIYIYICIMLLHSENISKTLNYFSHFIFFFYHAPSLYLLEDPVPTCRLSQGDKHNTEEQEKNMI